jgi:uncharacterized lipoprotein YddW (UPF0748 family)
MIKVNLKWGIYALLLGFVAASCSKEDSSSPETDGGFDVTKNEVIAPKREIRAAWIATAYSLDWPSTTGNADAQKKELQNLLATSQSLNFNAVIFQVRPMADAMYASNLEPWSNVLTGTQGVDPGYDPLAYAVEEAHKMGLQFHAWLNPYRIGSTSLALAANHIAVKNPSWVVTFNKVRYFNPGIPEVRAHLVAVVKDIITRYKVDAIQFDDYFYPAGAKATDPFVFDDKDAFAKYGNGLSITAWREQNVNTMVKEVYAAIKSTKPEVLFGISPSGRRENSVDLYADPFVWLENKWVDYLAPQVYWEFGHKTADFGKQAAFWNSNAKGIPIMLGVGAYKYKDPSYPAYGSVDEIGRQLDEVQKSSNIFGCFFYRMQSIKNAELSAFLKAKYESKALPPVMGTRVAPVAKAPVVSLAGSAISWKAVSGADKYAVYALDKNGDKPNSYLAKTRQIGPELTAKVESGKIYYVTAVNSENVESVHSNFVVVP